MTITELHHLIGMKTVCCFVMPAQAGIQLVALRATMLDEETFAGLREGS